MTAPAAELSGVSLSLRGNPILEDVSLRIEACDCLALVGPNGAGKTTLLKVLLGLLKPDRGTVRVLGRSPIGARGEVGFVPQHAGFDLEFPIRVRDVVLMGRLGASRLGRASVTDRSAAREALERVEMERSADRPIGALSGGQLQRVLIARALAQRPRLLLLDEPTASLDERIGRSIWELFGELSAEIAVVVVSHDIGAVSRSVRRVACLNRRLYAHPSTRLDPDILEAAYGGPLELLTHGHPRDGREPDDGS